MNPVALLFPKLEQPPKQRHIVYAIARLDLGYTSANVLFGGPLQKMIRDREVCEMHRLRPIEDPLLIPSSDGHERLVNGLRSGLRSIAKLCCRTGGSTHSPGVASSTCSQNTFCDIRNEMNAVIYLPVFLEMQCLLSHLRKLNERTRSATDPTVSMMDYQPSRRVMP